MTTKRRITIECDAFGAFFVITARCGCQFAVRVSPAMRWPEDMCRAVEQHLDFHESHCEVWHKVLALAVATAKPVGHG